MAFLLSYWPTLRSSSFSRLFFLHSLTRFPPSPPPTSLLPVLCPFPLYLFSSLPAFSYLPFTISIMMKHTSTCVVGQRHASKTISKKTTEVCRLVVQWKWLIGSTSQRGDWISTSLRVTTYPPLSLDNLQRSVHNAYTFEGLLKL